MKRAFIVLVTTFVLAAMSCREPTQIVIEARTNVTYRAGIVTSFTVGSPGQTERAEETTETSEPWQGSTIGTLVVVPGSADDAALSVKLVMGVARNARECTAPDYQGCIVARRRLRYVPHEKLQLPITLYAQCQDVPCDELSTCSVLGQCVPADVPCEDDTCDLPGEDAGVVDGSTTTMLDATSKDASSNDASSDATNDATNDAASDATNDVLGGGTTSTVDCPGAPSNTCGTTAGTFCCFDPVKQTGTCMTDFNACITTSRNPLRCDDGADCPGQICCHPINSPFSGCLDSCLRGAGYERICHGDGLCDNGEKCTKLLYGHYYACEP